MPTSHLRLRRPRDETVEFRRVGGVNSGGDGFHLCSQWDGSQSMTSQHAKGKHLCVMRRRFVRMFTLYAFSVKTCEDSCY